MSKINNRRVNEDYGSIYRLQQFKLKKEILENPNIILDGELILIDKKRLVYKDNSRYYKSYIRFKNSIWHSGNPNDFSSDDNKSRWLEADNMIRFKKEINDLGLKYNIDISEIKDGVIHDSTENKRDSDKAGRDNKDLNTEKLLISLKSKHIIYSYKEKNILISDIAKEKVLTQQEFINLPAAVIDEFYDYVEEINNISDDDLSVWPISPHENIVICNGSIKLIDLKILTPCPFIPRLYRNIISMDDTNMIFRPIYNYDIDVELIRILNKTNLFNNNKLIMGYKKDENIKNRLVDIFNI